MGFDVPRRQFPEEPPFGVQVYTVNDRRRAFELLDGGIDGLISDIPGEMAVWVETWRRSALASGNP